MKKIIIGVFVLLLITFLCGTANVLIQTGKTVEGLELRIDALEAAPPSVITTEPEIVYYYTDDERLNELEERISALEEFRQFIDSWEQPESWGKIHGLQEEIWALQDRIDALEETDG